MVADRSFADLWIWDRVGDRLPWYYAVSTNRMPAKYLIARRIPCEVDLRQATEEKLWAEHARLTGRFVDLWEAIREDEAKLRDRPRAPVSLVDLSVELVQRMLQHCNFCRWKCHVNRSAGTKHGTCHLESTSRVGSYFHHPGEELVFRGTQGSGTIFFTSCNLRCQFCFVPSTVVLTEDGPRSMEDLYRAAARETRKSGGHIRQPEELYAFSQKSQLVRIRKIFKHLCEGEVVRIDIPETRPIWATPGHEFLVIRNRGTPPTKVQAADIAIGNCLVVPNVATSHMRMSADLQEDTDDGLVSVGGISRAPYDGSVYNLEVDDPSHTYIANFVAVGNCQNGDISHDKDNGIPVTPQQLAAMAWQLRMEGCHNINWVGGEPTIHLHSIIEAISLLDGEKPNPRDVANARDAKSDYADYRLHPELAFYHGEFNAPMLWNSNFFMSEETMQILRPLIDVWLPDFKFGSDRCSIFLSRTPWYWETVTRNHQMVYGWGEDMVIRHLIMPDHVDCCTKPVLKWIADHTPTALVNVMDQYHPDYACDPCSSQYDPRYKALARRPRREEILESYAYARELGLRFEDVTFEKARVVLPQRATISG